MRRKRFTAFLLSLLLLCACRGGSLPTETIAFDESGSPTEETLPAVKIQETTAPTETAEASPKTEAAETQTSPKTETTTISETTEAAETTERTTVKREIDPEAFDRAIAEYAEAYNAVGMGLCVFADGKVIHEFDWGYADTENEIPCDTQTVYRVASVSKLISAMVLMTLYDEGKITPDSDLEELTGLPFNPAPREERVRLWHLLTHTAGLVDSDTYEDSSSPRYSAAYVLEHSRSGNPPGRYYSYCNFGAGLIGAVTELLSGEYFHYYAQKAVFSKLDMDAAYCADLLEHRENCAELYTGGVLEESPKSWYRLTYYYESFGLGNSYLCAQCELLIKPSDLARLGIVLADGGCADGVRILSEDAVKKINTPYFSPEDKPYDVGLCTRIYDGNVIEGRTLYGHSGNALGGISGLYYDPADHTGVALCTNGCYVGESAENGLYLILDSCLKKAYETFFE